MNANEKMEDPHLANRSPLPSDGIVLGITRDVVFAEIAALIGLKLAHILKIDPEDITCSIALAKGKVIPEIQVDGDAAEGLEPTQIKEVIQSVWWGVKPELEQRLQDLGSRRGKEET
jgi:hypothetical protein